MSRSRYFSIALMLSALGLNITPLGLQVAAAQTPAPAATPAPAETVRPEVGKPIQAAQDLLKDKKYKEALDKLNEITVADKTPYEAYVIARTRAAIASASGDNALALDSLQAVVATGRLQPADQLKFIEAIGDLYFHKPDYAQAVAWTTRYLKEGGDDPRAHDLLVRSYYLNNDFTHAAEELQLDMAAAEKAGAAPTEEQLRILVSLAVKQNDKVAYVAAVEKYVTYYPKKEYWGDLVNRVRAKPGYSNLYDLDYYRLKFAMGLMTKPGEFTEMAELSTAAGFSAEAKKVLEAGIKAGVFAGAEADHQKHQLELATKKSTDDLNTIAQTEAEVRKSKDGIGSVNLGYVYVTNGQFDKGIALMEHGLSIGGLKHPEEAKLRLATAYVLAGRNQDAIQAFKAIQGGDGSGDLARYWVMELMHPIP